MKHSFQDCEINKTRYIPPKSTLVTAVSHQNQQPSDSAQSRNEVLMNNVRDEDRTRSTNAHMQPVASSDSRLLKQTNQTNSVQGNETSVKENVATGKENIMNKAHSGVTEENLPQCDSPNA